MVILRKRYLVYAVSVTFLLAPGGFLYITGRSTVSSFLRKTQNWMYPLHDKQANIQQMQMTERIYRKEHACGVLDTDKEVQSIKHKHVPYSPIIVYSPDHNLSYCGVGKAGGTFMKQLFFVLINGVNQSRVLENLDRLNVHKPMDEHKAPFESKTWRSSRLITVGRNPYTRLFSAYIDRVYAPSIDPEFRTGSKCLFDVTFEEFLRTIINDIRESIFNQHWSPIYYICKACQVKSTFIVKQETFTDDIQFTLDALKVKADIRSELVRKMTESRNAWSITTVMKEQMNAAQGVVSTPGCIGWFGILKRIWTVVQVTGYIDENIDIPMSLYNDTNDFSNSDLLLQTIFDTMNKYPLSSEARQMQRKRALVSAYSSVDKTILEDIKRVYRPDFAMFGYTDEPPV